MSVFAIPKPTEYLSKYGRLPSLAIPILLLYFVLLTSTSKAEAQESPTVLSITAQTVDLMVTEGEDATLTVTATGSGTLAYQWFADGEPISGATDSTLTISSVALDDSGTVYSVEISDDNNFINSKNVSLEVIEIRLPMPKATASDVINYGLADYSRTEGSRFSRVNFMPKVSGEATIELEWDGPESMNLAVFESDTGIRLASDTSESASIKQITLNLDADTQYHANAWINSGKANWVMRRVQVVPDPDADINSARDSAPRPNIVLINTDDQRDDTLDRLPAIQRYLSQKGVTYTNAIVPTPSCCPSRATLLSGRYVHNNGQVGQQTENPQILEKTVNKYLQQEGYFTGTAGKYLHWIDTDEAPAPYWDRWTNIKGGFYGVSMNFDGKVVRPGGYTTDIVFERTKDYLREFEARDDDKPWFVYLAPMAPHSPYTAEHDLRNEPVAPYLTNPDYQETDVSDKPGFIQYRSIDDATARDVFEKRIRSLYSVDREVEELVEYLEDSGEIDNTMIIFTSDNGYLLGEHQTIGKFTPWRKSVQVPLVISWPGRIAENVTNDTFVSQVDISRTILEAAGVDTSGLSLDGHNIFDETRDSFYMEYFRDPASNGGRIESWASIRAPSYQYTEWYDKDDESEVSFREYYDMVADPFQLDNLLGNADTTDDPDYSQLSHSLNRQRTCAGAYCRAEADSQLVIFVQPADLTITEGEDATFTVNATGSGTLGYQWAADGIPLSGETSSSLTVFAATLLDDGVEYSVEISDDFGTITSDVAILTVQEESNTLLVSTQPMDLAISEGDEASFAVVASGVGTLGYQWFVNGDAVADATKDILVVGPASMADDGNIYRVEITDDNGSISSASATLDVIETALPAAIVNIGEGTLDHDKNAGPRWVRLTFDSLATAVHTVKVYWDTDADVRFNVFESDGTRISSTVRGTNPGVWSGELGANKQYYVGLWTTGGVVNYTANVEAAVTVSMKSQPADLIATEGDDATFSMIDTGSEALNYQRSADGSAIPSETDKRLTAYAAALDEDGTESPVEMSNDSEATTSSFARPAVNENLVLGLFSQEADTSAWMLAGPAPTLDYEADEDTKAWGNVLLRIGDLLLVGGDFEGIKPNRNGPVTDRPFLAAIDAVSGQPVSTFRIPSKIDGVVRALVRSPDGNQVYVGGDFGMLALDAKTGSLDFEVSVTSGESEGRVFDIATTNDRLYIGGDFDKVENTFRANIARLSLGGELDFSWGPIVSHGFATGGSAPVQSLAVSPSGDTVYVGGNFHSIDDIAVSTTPRARRISMLTLNASDGSVRPERFSPDVDDSTRDVTAYDIEVTDFYVIVAWGGPSLLTFHSLGGDLLRQYEGEGDVQALQVLGDHVFVGHHGDFFGSLTNPIPPEAVESLDPEIIRPFKLHSFRIDDPSFLQEQAWSIGGPSGVWGIAASEDSIWITGQISRAGSSDRLVDGLARFPALD